MAGEITGSYRLTFFLPGGMVKIENNEVEVAMERNLTSHELAVVGVINEAVARLNNGHFTHYEHSPKSFENPQEMIKCEWLRSGNLKIHGPTKVLYHLVETTQEALDEHRTFTCYRKLLPLIPKSRVVSPIKAADLTDKEKSILENIPGPDLSGKKEDVSDVQSG